MNVNNGDFLLNSELYRICALFAESLSEKYDELCNGNLLYACNEERIKKLSKLLGYEDD